MILDDMKKRMLLALKQGRAVEKEILRVAIGEIQTQEARGATPGDEGAVQVVRKLIKSGEETLGLATDPVQKNTLEEEIRVLRDYLPQSLGVDQIVDALAPVREAIRAAGNDGQATGVAMKHLKGAGLSVQGKDVSEAVRKVRA